MLTETVGRDGLASTHCQATGTWALVAVAALDPAGFAVAAAVATTASVVGYLQRSSSVVPAKHEGFADAADGCAIRSVVAAAAVAVAVVAGMMVFVGPGPVSSVYTTV